MTLTDSNMTKKPKISFIVEPTPQANKFAELDVMLQDGLAAFGQQLSTQDQQKIFDYIELLIKWNRAYNLTSVREPREIMTRHILDSLSAGPHLSGNFIIDVGTGAGFPGIPLALAYPDREFTLLDSNGKKARFLFYVQNQLKINNIRIVNERVEGFQKNHDLKEASRYRRFDTIISRAYSSLREMLFNTEHLCSYEGVFLAMKGVYPLTELHEVPPGFKLIDVVKLDIPHLNAERHLVKLAME